SGVRGIFVLDAALLFELGMDTLADFTVTVRDTMERSVARIVERDGLTEGTALGRWRSQMDIHEKCARSHFVIDNRKTTTVLHNIATDIFLNVLTIMNTEE
ncbi:MAG TPA: dephospho-CoA kinase, partial [Candidatus Sabulitectum sp.]|nr:dephospho-CoA kinase [Candidatus Sabulitectum sp.]